MLSALKTYLDIALLRRGPSDLPASTSLLVATVSVFLALNIGLSAWLRPQIVSLVPQHLVSVAVALGWYFILLRLFARPERYVQMITAVFGVGCVVAPILVPASAFVARYAERPQEAMPYMILLLPLAGYVVYVSARILRDTIERPMFQCVMLVLAQTMLEALILVSLFGSGQPAAAG